ncbi:MAG: radical SAM protein [Myxococcales bacterium]|nr:radical SAM protein [Myxococcales bacterium]
MAGRDIIRQRLADEVGTIVKDAAQRIALLYPSPYHVGMSSLGFQTIYREINGRPGWSAERAFLPDDVDAQRNAGAPLCSYESQRPVSDFPLLAFSVAYEIELAGVIQLLELSGVPVLAEDRDGRHPLVLAGGPLTNSNPLPLAPFADAILMGEADETIHRALDLLAEAESREDALALLAAEIDSCYVPSLHGETLPSLGQCEDARLPAWSAIRTPHTELSDMFLIETERGCSRGCKYCVMRRSTNGGMRIVPMERILELVPQDAPKVGLVGAAVSDHPKVVELVEQLSAGGRRVSLSSLRPDRLKAPFVAALRKAGGRVLTTALDASSQRLRDTIDRRAREDQLLRVAQLAREHRFAHLKLYMMVGLPDETDADIDELVRFGTELSRIVPVALGIAPFVAKRNTPLDGAPFAGLKTVEARLSRLRRGLRGRVDIRATSSRWAWVEYELAQGGAAAGLAVLDAVRAGGRFADYRRAFEATPAERRRRTLRVVA